MKKITIHDVAKKAKVSAATVSRVLNGTARVKPEKVQHVQAVIKKLGYRPNALAHSLAQGKTSGNIGVIARQFSGEFFSLVISAFEHELRKEGFNMIFSSSHNSAEEEKRCLQTMTESGVEGLFLMAPCLPDKELLALTEGTPTVLMNRFIPELTQNCITIDNRAGGYIATKHLLDLGHKRIACITAPLTRQYSRHRLEGYTEALREKSITLDDNLILEADDYNYESGFLAVNRLLSLSDFTAIFASNDLLAGGALKALQTRNIAVPEAVSIIGFDNLSLSRLTTPSLSTMHYPTQEMGERSAEHLIKLIKNTNPEQMPVFKSNLVTRESSALKSSSVKTELLTSAI